MSASAESEDKKEIKQHKGLYQIVRTHLFQNNYTLVSSLKLSLPMAYILITFEQLQKVAIISRLATNPTISNSSQMSQIDLIARYMLLDILDITGGVITRPILMLLLLLAQMLMSFCYLVDLRQELLRKFFSKVVVVLQMVLTIPSILSGIQSIVLRKDIPLAAALLLFTLANTLIYCTMQVQCSFQRENENVLVRPPSSLTPKLIEIATIAVFPLLSAVIYPTSFTIYLVGYLITVVWQWSILMRSFVYFQESLTCLKGILISVNISGALCYLSISLLDNAIISQNVLVFIIAFSFFLGYFFVVFRNYVIKSTIINQELKQEQDIAIFCVFYWHCFRKITQKKNELYLSSLLKKHLNECQSPTCCCKHRELLYDHALKTYGNPDLQPHFDRIFIRHFIRKLLSQGYEEHSKSTMLALLLSTFDIEALEMVTQPMELIHKLTRMQQKKQLTFMEEYLLFCLKQKTKRQIASINSKRGNLQLENVKAFDEKLITLQMQLKESIKLYNSLWKNLNHSHLNETQLYRVCKDSLQMMFAMEKVYEDLKAINIQSLELKTIMIFYSKMVLHDIHLLSQIKKDIKSHHERNIIVSNIELGSLRLFGPYTATFITLESGKIKWTSKNAHSLFEYTREEFQGLTVNQLMPKYFGDRHDGYIKKWKETGHHIMLNSTNFIWCSTKQGYCFTALNFVKIILLNSQQDYAFFACLEKLDDQHPLICTQRGQIIGCGKLFAESLAVNPKTLQELQPNLQVFVPSSFQYFLEHFFPDQSKHKNKKAFDIRREGYFPEEVEKVMKQLCYSRTIFERNHSKQDNFQKEYLSFVKQKMQELTCSVNGEYVSFLMDIVKVVAVKRNKCSILTIRVSNPKRDNVQRYYTDLEKMIKKLHEIVEENNHKKAKTTQKKNRSDFFRAFLNPRKVKKMLMTEKKEETVNQEDKPDDKQSKSDSYLKSDSFIGSRQRKTPTMLVAHRKQLALGAQAQIKNQRVKYNLWKMKKVLFEEGIISRYTYNLLIGKQVSLSNQSLKNIQPQAEETERKSLKRFEDDRESDGGAASLDNDNNSEQGLDRPQKQEENDCQTFNSASSSATFISMTNQVKFFKHKLRSLNSPRPLLILNVLIVLMAIGSVGGLLGGLFVNLEKSDNGLSDFRDTMESDIIISLLLEGQFNIVNLQNDPTNSMYLTKKRYMVDRASRMFQGQIKRRMNSRQIDPRILSYLYLVIVDHDTPIQVKQFIQIIIDQMIYDNYSHIQKYFLQTLNDLHNYNNHNIFFQSINSQLLLSSTLLACVAFLLFLMTIPIVRKIKTKIKDIYGLLSHISFTEKARYHRHFKQLHEEFRKNNNDEDLSRLLNNFDSKGRSFQLMSHQQLSDDDALRGDTKSQTMRAQNYIKQSKIESSERDREDSISESRIVYLQLAGVFGVLVGAMIFYFLFVGHFIGNVQTASSVFNKAFNQQSMATISFIECNNQLSDYADEAPSYSPTIGLVSAIYQSYHFSTASSIFKDYLYQFVTGPVCPLLTESSLFNSFTAAEVALCQTVNNGTFSKGAINNIYYCQRKIEEQLTAYYVAKNYTPNDQSNLHYPPYFLTQEYYQINVGHFFNSVMIYQLFDQMFLQMERQVGWFKGYLTIGAIVGVVLVLLFLGLWLWIYWGLAESSSYINAFLLLIPFNILTENPYIKLYIRNQFDYKVANY